MIKIEKQAAGSSCCLADGFHLRKNAVQQMLGRVADEAYVDAHQEELAQFSDVVKAHWAYYQIVEATNAHEYTKDNNTESWTELV